MDRCKFLGCLLLIGSGCGSEKDDNSCDGLGAVPEQYLPPADLAAQLCQPGTFRDFAPTGSWYYTVDGHGIFSGSGPVKLEPRCGEGFEVALGLGLGTTPISHTVLTDDHLYWRRSRTFEVEGGISTTVYNGYALCGTDAQGDYVGTTVECLSSGGESNCDPPKPMHLKRFERLSGEVESEGLTLVAEFRGSDWDGNFVATVKVQEDLAYVAIGTGGLRIVDVSSPDAPKQVGRLPATSRETINDLKVIVVNDKEYVLLASSARGMVVVDVSDPSKPREVVAVTPNAAANHGIHTLFVEEISGVTVAYLADGRSNEITIWNLEDPSKPVQVASYASEDEAWAVHDMFVDEGRMYLNATVGGMLVVDTQPDPTEPVVIGRLSPQEYTYSHASWLTTIGGRRIAVHGDEGYDAHFKTVDVEPDSPTFLQILGRYQTRPEVSAHNLIVVEDKAYVAYYQDGVRVLDISDPVAPKLEAYYNTWSPQTGAGGRFAGALSVDVDLDKGLIYVADEPRGLLILHID